MKKVAFEVLIKDIHSRSLVSGDKATRVVLEFESTNQLEVLQALDELHKADNTVAVAIAEIKKTQHENG